MKRKESEKHMSLKSASEIALERAAAAQPAAGEEGLAGEGQAVSQEIEALVAQAAKAQENWARTQADFDNFRKRTARERQELIKSANERLLQDLLAPLDHFEMGLQSAQKTSQDDPLRQGMEMVLAQFQQFLSSQGVTEIQALGQPFDPALHEAVAHQESPEPEGQVTQQLRKGYRLNDKLLRPASVIVSKGPDHGQS